MAQLPPDGTWLIQSIDSDVIVANRDTQEVLARWVAADPDSFGPGLATVHGDPRLTEEGKAFAAFWAGYFYAYARGL